MKGGQGIITGKLAGPVVDPQRIDAHFTFHSLTKVPSLPPLVPNEKQMGCC